MAWIHGSITLEDGSTYGGQFFVKDDGQLDEVFRPELNEDNIDEDEEVLAKEVNPYSVYQLPPV